MLAQVNLPLRNIHATESVPWWPLAPGWWFVIAALVVGLIALRHWQNVRAMRRARVIAFFDAEVSKGESVPAQVAQVSQLLRRAARQHVPAADTLQGEAWLELLNRGMKDKPFRGEVADLLLEGGFRKQANAMTLEQLLLVAQRRFALWVRDA